eukprot:jgi/Orpsp1_1/1185188/evm.model.c7180000092666.1
MSEFLNAWLKSTVIDIINDVVQKEKKEISIESIIKNFPQKKSRRVQIDKFLKCPTENNPNEKCELFVVDKCNYITAIFSPIAINKFNLNNSEIPLTSLRGCYIILNSYNFDYDRKTKEIYLNVDEFENIGGQPTVYSNDIQSINEIPTVKAFIAILNQKIKEGNNEEIYHYGWNGINEISDEDCYISSEDRNILDKLPGWSDSDSTYSEILNNKNNNIINENDSLFNSQSIFEIIDYNNNDNSIMYNQDQNNESNLKEKKRSEKRYREAISDDTNSSENDMIIEKENDQKRIKINNSSSLNSEIIFFSQPIDIFHESQDVN